METVTDFIFLDSKITADTDCSHETKRYLLFGRKVVTNIDKVLKIRYITLPIKVCIVKAMVFPVVMYWRESWIINKAEVPKNWCFWTVVLEKTLESPLDSKEIKQVNPKGNQPCIFTGRTDAEAPILWSPNAKSWLIVKDPDAGKDLRQKKKRVSEDEMVGWHHWLNTWVWTNSGRQWSLVCCSPWGHKELDVTKQQQQWCLHVFICLWKSTECTTPVGNPNEN